MLPSVGYFMPANTQCDWI